jgi:hypothetical protein
MIYLPSIPVKIKGFLDSQNKITKNPTKRMLIQTEKGDLKVIAFLSNKKNLTDEDVQKWFQFKNDRLIKESQLLEIGDELEFNEDFEDKFEQFKEGKEIKDRKALLALKKEFKLLLAKQYYQKMKSIKVGSIIDIPVAIPTKEYRKRAKEEGRKTLYIQDPIKIEGFDKPIDVYTSRSIMFDRESGKCSQNYGIKILSITPTAVPLIIKPAFDKENHYLGFNNISVCNNFADKKHFIFMLKIIAQHMENGLKKSVLTNFVKFWIPKDSKLTNLKQLVTEYNNLTVNKGKFTSEDICQKAIDIIRQMEQAVREIDIYTIRRNLYIRLSAPWFNDEKLILEKIEDGGDSSLSLLASKIVKMNFKQLEDDMKKMLIKEAKDWLKNNWKANRDAYIISALQNNIISPSGEYSSFINETMISAFVLDKSSTYKLGLYLQAVLDREIAKNNQ